MALLANHILPLHVLANHIVPLHVQLLLKPWHKTELDGLLDNYESNACTIQRGLLATLMLACVLYLDIIAFRRHSSKKKAQRRQVGVLQI